MSNEKKKVLLAGNQDAIIDDFFLHTDEVFTCMTTSHRVEDLKNHIQYFTPDVFVYCLGKDVTRDSENIWAAKEMLQDAETLVVLIGDKAQIEEVSALTREAVDLHLIKPISIKKVEESIEKVLKERRLLKEKEEKEVLAEKAKAEQAEKIARAAGKTIVAPLAPGEKRRILVVDDDPVMLRTIKRYLEEKYVVATAPSGKFALKFLSQKHTDLVLLDYEMPEMSGSDVFKEIKANDNTATIPVVFLTGISDSHKIKTVLAMQPNGYLLKPVDYNRLHQTLDGIFGE